MVLFFCFSGGIMEGEIRADFFNSLSDQQSQGKSER
jgi:hypothetical protein